MGRVATVLVAAVAIFTLGGFFGVPALLRHLGRARLAAALHRQVTVGTVKFNPYTLRLTVDHLHFGEHDGPQAFADIWQIRVHASWRSLFRIAPIIQQLEVERPSFHIIRTGPDRFNFSDLFASSSQAGTGQSTEKSKSRPFLFSVSNIRVTEGKVWFEDRVLHENHAADRIEMGIPFIANLPADVDIFVQPVLKMRIDGSPFRIVGMTKPFASGRESIIALRLRRLDLPRFASYLVSGLPLKIAQGLVTTNLEVHFVQPESGPVIHIGGKVLMESFDIRDGANATLLGLKRGIVVLNSVEPLDRSVIIGAINVQGLTANLAVRRGGQTNFTPLATALGGPPAAGLPVQPFNVMLGSLQIFDSALKYIDASSGTPVTLELDDVAIQLRKFATNKQAPPFSVQAQARLGAGSLALRGAFDLPRRQVSGEISLDKIDLPPLQSFAAGFWAGTISSGTLSLNAKLQSTLTSGRFTATVQSAGISLDNLELRAPGDGQRPIQVNHLNATLDRIDLASHQARVKEVKVDGLRTFIRRSRDGRLSLAAFLRESTSEGAQPPATSASSVQTTANSKPTTDQASVSLQVAQPASAANPQSQPWQYQIASVAIENSEAGVEDDSAPQPLTVNFAPLNLHLKDISSDFTKPFGLAVDASLKPQGTFKIDGSAALNPLKADLKINAQRIDVTPVDIWLGSRLNARLTKAFLNVTGAVAFARAREKVSATYRGDVSVSNLRLLDKLTNERFLRWNGLTARDIEADLDGGEPRVRVGELALSDFFARLILNSDGQLNVRDIIKRPGAAPTSLTRENPAGAEMSKAAASQNAAASTTRDSIPADVEIRRTVMRGGSINFTDNFIKPHYSAQLTEIAGKIGAFGTRSTKPADLELQGEVNSSAPIDITGSLNPLAPKAFVDIKAKADGIDLPDLTPYSAKYTGYPITQGTLNVDVHYHLENDELTAINRLFIDQLTFGPRVQSPYAINLPIATAVALLKNSKGEINVSVPISGSLSDPQFNFGEIIAKALSNLILKAVSAPFSVLALAAGSPGQKLDYVEFQPGLATLTPASQERLDALAKALKDRAALRLSISGRVDLAVDRKALRAAMVERLIKRQKVKELREQGDIVNIDTVELTPSEYDKYLKLAYDNAKFSKPRNFLGLAKSLPPDEMKKLLLANTDVTDADLKQLANARAAAVRRFLAKQINPSRLAVVAPTLDAKGVTGKGKTTRVDLAIS